MVIKFRAWDIGEKKWMEEDVNLSYNFDGKRNNYRAEGIANSGIEFSQFTGLKDYDGDEIFIGDILLWSNDGIIIIEEKDELGFYYEMIKSFEDNVCSHDIRFYRSEEASKVLGNKFDNPEMERKLYWTKKKTKELINYAFSEDKE